MPLLRCVAFYSQLHVSPVNKTKASAEVCHKSSKARFKRRISHVPNITRELNACEVRRLNQLNSTVYIESNATFAVSATETIEDST